jgi:hypothetical protein
MAQRHPTTPAQRTQAVVHLLAHAGDYGVVTALSHTLGVSRQTLYTWRAHAQQALEQVLGPPLPSPAVPVLERQILTLLVEGHASYRGIQTCLHTLTGQWVSLDTITNVIAIAQQRALTWMGTHMPPTSRPLALDEIYGNDRHGAYLHGVDALSGAVWLASGPVPVDAESWTLLLWEGQACGLRWHLLATDGGTAMQEACRCVRPDVPQQRDLWHVLHRASQAQARLQRKVADLAAQTPIVARQAARVAAGQRPRGRHPKTDVAAHATELATARQVVAALHYLLQELRRLVEVVVLERDRLLGLVTRQGDLEALLALLAELTAHAPAGSKAELEQLLTHVQQALPQVLTFVASVERVQQQLQGVLPAAQQALLGWAWQRRKVLRWQRAHIVASVPEGWREAAQLLLAAWEGAVRGSSTVEGWHSVLRPHLAVHRVLSPGVLALLAVWHNHRISRRGVHRGQSPLQRSGLREVAADWLVALGYPPADAHAADPLSSRPQAALALAA